MKGWQPLFYPALDYPSSSKILGLPNVWSSDLPVCSMFLNSQTLGRSWDTLGRSRGALGALLGSLGALLELLGRSWGLLGASWTPALEASPFKTRNSGSPECEGSVAHFCLFLAVLGCLLVSFWLSWDAFGPHFGSLGASWGAL